MNLERCSSPFRFSMLLLIALGCLVSLAGCGDEAGDPSPAPGETPSLTPISTLSPDADHDGAPDSLDCAPSDPAIHPGAPEECDEKDNNCDGRVDEGLTTAYYTDADGDGYGSNILAEVFSLCSPLEGYAPNHLDCDDAAPKTYPGAIEQCDGIDNDCDGQAEDSLLANSWYLDQDGDGFGVERVQVADCLDLNGVAPARGDCDDLDPAVHPGAADAAGSGRDEDCGGFDGPDPSLGLEHSSYTALQPALDDGVPGTVLWVGPGVYLEHDLSIATDGLVLASTHGPEQTTLDARGLGRVLAFEPTVGPDTVFDGFTVTGGRADGGGGIWLQGGPVLRWFRVIGCIAGDGGGIYSSGSTAVLDTCLVAHNVASEGIGGGLDHNGAEFQPPLTIRHCTIVDNQGRDGGGLSAGAPIILEQSILAFNGTLNLIATRAADIDFSVLYAPAGVSHWSLALSDTNHEVDPGFVSFQADADPLNDDFNLLPDSSIRDSQDTTHCHSADVSGCDPDGTAPDPGFYGGPLASDHGTRDADQDMIYDAWEVARGLDPQRNDAQDDPDGDSLTNEVEFLSGTDPKNPDTDGDGFQDGEEQAAARDPLNPWSQPGVEGLVPIHVPEDVSSLQEALDAIPFAGRIVLSSGTVTTTATVTGKHIVLEGDETNLQPQQADLPVLEAIQSTLELRSITVAGAVESQPNAVHLWAVKGEFEDVDIRDSATLGLSAYCSDLTLSGMEIARNTDGLVADRSSIFLRESLIRENVNRGIYLRDAELEAEDSRVLENGQGLVSSSAYSPITLLRTELSGNLGAGLICESCPDSDIQLRACVISRNKGGGISNSQASLTLDHCTIVGNESDAAGGVESDSPVRIENSILAYNLPYNLRAREPDGISVTYTDLFSASGLNHTLLEPDPTVLVTEPRFVAFDLEGGGSGDVLSLRPGSPLIDAGDPAACHVGDSSACDPDGSLPDLGAFGGPDGLPAAYADVDADGVYDEWELEHGLDTARDDSDADPDADGLSNADEYAAGTDPSTADSDADGFSDGAEVAAGRDPLNPFSQPGVDGIVPLRVPGQYASIQDAIDAIPLEGRIEVQPGSWPERLSIAGKRVTLVGVSGAAETIIDAEEQGSVITGSMATVALEGLTLQGGRGGEAGGGGYFDSCDLHLKDVVLQQNVAQSSGGGLMTRSSFLSLEDCTIRDNSAYEGGGILLESSTARLERCRIEANDAQVGGGIYLTTSSAVGAQLEVYRNTARDGGGVSVQVKSAISLAYSVVAGNAASDEGGGLYVYDSVLELEHSAVLENDAAYGGGILDTYSDEVSRIRHTILAWNSPLAIASE